MAYGEGHLRMSKVATSLINYGRHLQKAHGLTDEGLRLLFKEVADCEEGTLITNHLTKKIVAQEQEKEE